MCTHGAEAGVDPNLLPGAQTFAAAAATRRRKRPRGSATRADRHGNASSSSTFHADEGGDYGGAPGGGDDSGPFVCPTPPPPINPCPVAITLNAFIPCPVVSLPLLVTPQLPVVGVIDIPTSLDFLGDGRGFQETGGTSRISLQTSFTISSRGTFEDVVNVSCDARPCHVTARSLLCAAVMCGA